MDIHKAIGKLPFKPKRGYVLYRHRYTGPWNPLSEQLDSNDNPLPGEEPFNAVDEVSRRHDICYRDNNNKAGKRKCDETMLTDLDGVKPKNRREKVDKYLVKAVIKTKNKLGWGLVSEPVEKKGTIRWSDELAEELHKPIRRKFMKRTVFAKNVDDIWTADLVDMQPFSRDNKGYKYLLTVLDVFSKYGWIIPLKRKTGSEVADAFQMLFTNNKPPAKLWTDKGTEFYNVNMKKVLKEHNVLLYSTENEEKSSVVERWNRTMKTIMWKYFTANNTHTYINVLQRLVDKYNTTYHHSIKCTPSEARKPEKYTHVFEALFGKVNREKKKVPKFHVGDRVRISKKKKQFEKGFTPNWTEEVFVISEVKDTKPPTYTVNDLRGEPVKGTFYEEELQLSKQEVYRVERVLRKRKQNGVNEAFVKWKGYGKEFNSWIPASDLQQLK